MTTTAFAITLGIMFLFLLSAILHIGRIQKELIEIDKEQHTQNEEIIQLMKANMQHGEMLMQHIEILKYLVEQDPQLGKMRVPYGGVVGEA
jgi:hypothetical protein